MSHDVTHKLIRTMEHGETLPHSLAGRFKQACDFLGIVTDNDLNISFCGSQPIPIQEISPLDVPKILQAVTRNACYDLAGSTPRKDFQRTKQVLVFCQTISLLRAPKEVTVDEISNHTRFEPVPVGCVLTNDRLASTGWSESPACRLCDHPKETLHHLVHECPGVRDQIGPAVVHELGKNFGLLRHVHQPESEFVVRRRMLQLRATDLEVASSFDCNVCMKIWTDGSVIFSDNVWLMTGAYAVVNDQGCVLFKGQVNHIALSAYAAELWAEIVSGSKAVTKLDISDCQTVVQQATRVFEGNQPDTTWRCFHWWMFLFDLVSMRGGGDCSPFRISWIPAHKLEHIPVQYLTEDFAKACGSTVQHSVNNRVADYTAREFAASIAPVDPALRQQLKQAILGHQAWLVQLHSLLPTKEPDIQTPEPVPELPDVLTQHNAERGIHNGCGIPDVAVQMEA